MSEAKIHEEAAAAADFLASYSDESELYQAFPMVVTLMRVYAARMRGALSDASRDTRHVPHGPESAAS